MIEDHFSERVLILADDSACWRIAGLPQLERLALGLNEFAEKTGHPTRIEISISWKPGVDPSERCLPEASRFPRVRFSDSAIPPEHGARIISTRLFVERNGMASFFERTSGAISERLVVDPGEAWRVLFEQFELTCGDRRAGNGWRLLRNANEIGECEREFLHGAGKSQDGFVSKLLNRPISRWLTRFLLRVPITPTGWTYSIFILPLICSAFLMRGDYTGMVIGTLIYQLYSILDGCDGEIARAKYLESKAGGRIDDYCDIIGGLFFVVGLGIGLYRSSAVWVYAAEGFLCAAAIATNEFLLRRTKSEPLLKSLALGAAMYPRHRQLVENSGLAFFGENFAWFLVQLTKRDVGILFFVVLALAGLSKWILHLWGAVTAATLVLNLTAQAKARALTTPGVDT